MSSITPTKSGLIILKRRQETEKRVHKILEDKKEYQLNEIRKLIEQAYQARKQLNDSLLKARLSLAIATMRMGLGRVESAIFAVNPLTLTSHLLEKSLGLQVVKYESSGGNLTYSFGDTSVALDKAYLQMKDVLAKLWTVAEIESRLFQLSEDLKKTLRLVNMLEHIVIPSNIKQVSSIESSLEEKDREEFIRLKMIENELVRRHARRS